MNPNDYLHILYLPTLSWHPFESQEFKKWLKFINQHAPMTYRDELSNDLLDLIYNEVKEIVESDMKNSFSHSILVDESQDRCKDPIINYISGTSRPYLFDRNSQIKN